MAQQGADASPASCARGRSPEQESQHANHFARRSSIACAGLAAVDPSCWPAAAGARPTSRRRTAWGRSSTCPATSCSCASRRSTHAKNAIIFAKVKRHQGRPQADRDPPQHRPGRLRAARVAERHGLGRGRQGGRLLPQRRRHARRASASYWYQAYGNANDVNGWWGMSHGEPFLLRSFAGKLDKLAAGRRRHAGRQGGHRAVHGGRQQGRPARRGKAQIQRLKASLKLNDYNPKRDFVGWGGEDFRRVQGMPGFTHISALPRVDPDAQSISAVDFDGDGKPDLCLAGAGRVALLQNGGEAFGEVSLPGADRLPRGRVGRLQRRRPARPAAGHADRAEAVHQPRQGRLPRRHAPAAEGAGLQPDLRRLDRPGRRRPARHPAGQRLARPAAVPQQGQVERRAPASTLGEWHYIGPFPNTAARASTRPSPPEKEHRPEGEVQGQGRRGRLEAEASSRTARSTTWRCSSDNERRRRLPLPRDRLQGGDEAAGLARQRRRPGGLAQRQEDRLRQNGRARCAADQAR